MAPVGLNPSKVQANKLLGHMTELFCVWKKKNLRMIQKIHKNTDVNMVDVRVMAWDCMAASGMWSIIFIVD